MKTLALPLAALAALAACNTETDTTDDTAVVAEDSAAPTPPTPIPDTSPSLTPTPTELPAAMLGRWGLVPADCEPGRADAKGLMTVEAKRLRFYESVGTLDEIDEASATRIRADFDFTGEGMTWDRDMTIELQDGGRTLVRQEFGDDAIPGPLRYSKCS